MINDKQFEIHEIKSVEKHENSGGYTLMFKDGWCFYCPSNDIVIPEAGMEAKLYGKGFGYSIRGLVIDGKTVFYRTNDEDDIHRLEELYGKNVHDMLERWDDGKIVHTIEMGGIGPGYEQAIQIAMFECMRFFLQKEFPPEYWERPEKIKEFNQELDGLLSDILSPLGLSGAQWVAAKNLAACFLRQGPVKIMTEPSNKDRSIQVCKDFPHL